MSDEKLFADLPPTAESHFKIYFFGTVLLLLEQLSPTFGSLEKVLERIPFLTSYNNEFADRLDGMPLSDAVECWWRALEVWEGEAGVHLPLRALRVAAGVHHAAIAWLLSVGFTEEDARFGAVFESLQVQTGGTRPTVAALRRCWSQIFSNEETTALLNRFSEHGIVRVLNPDAPRSDWALQVPHLLWDALHGNSLPNQRDGFCYQSASELPALDEIILAGNVRSTLGGLVPLLKSGETTTVVVRGPHHNGRRTALGALARALGRGVIFLRGEKLTDESWRMTGTLALLLHAMPVVEFEAVPGETLTLNQPGIFSVPVGVVMSQHGGLTGTALTSAVTVQMPMPNVATREQFWARHLANGYDAREFGERFRLTSGSIQHVANIAHAHAAIAGREKITCADVLDATRTWNRRTIDTLARRVPVEGDFSRFCSSERTCEELKHFGRRCRHRERLPEFANLSGGENSNCGVRALFHGASGTGKTLAAQLIAATLHKDLYQVDLAAVLDKYLGETEKRLNRVFDLAEELDVILLLDEGDALLTARTDIHTSNDRHSNAQTNFLLQRVASFDGILIVTTNSRSRIDPSFERRMDVVIDFNPPGPEERRGIWYLHLPRNHNVGATLVDEISARCAFSGGQIRNAAMHAALLALDNGGIVTSAYVEAAVRREYLKLGMTCPLR